MIRVTKLVYQIGLTTFFRSQGRENILAAASSKQASSSSSSSKQATELISAYPHISVSIDGKSPKLSWYIVLMMPYNHTKFRVKNHKGVGSVGKKVVKIREIPKIWKTYARAREGGYWGGLPLGDKSTYLCQHRRDITQTFMVDSPSDNIQTHKVFGRNSPRDRVGGQKSLENPKKVMKSCPSEAPGRALARAERGRMTIEPENHRTTVP